MGWPWDDEGSPQDPGRSARFDPDLLNAQAKRALTRPHLPSPDELLREKERQQKEEQSGFLSTILGLPEKVLFGQAIKGAVEGAAMDGFAGGVEGFLRGTPFAFAWDTINDLWDGEDVSRVTSFAEIRKAFGATDVDEGAGNLLINLLGEIALSPIELFAAPFALTKAGVAAKTAMQSGETLARSLELGHRAALVLKIPGLNVATNLGFKSGFVLPAKLLDGLGDLARTNPIAKAVAKTFELSYNLPTLDSAKRAKQALDVRNVASRSLLALSEIQMRGLAPETRQLAATRELADFFTIAGEVGIENIDFAGSPDGVIAALRNPDVIRKTAARDAALKTNSHLRELWDKATLAGDKQAGAIQEILRRYPEIPLTDDMLAVVGMERRVGVETTWIGEAVPPVGDPALAQTTRAAAADALSVVPANRIEGDAFTIRPEPLAGVPDAPTPATLQATPKGFRAGVSDEFAARADTSTAVRAEISQAVREGREGVVNTFLKLRDDIAKGKISGAAANEWLAFQKQTFTRIGMAEIMAGLMNDSLEPWLGLYSPHIISENTWKTINDRFLSVMKDKAPDFAAPRHLRDMTAMEANIVAREFGLRATGFIPTKQLQKKGSLAVWQKIFDNDFIKKLHKVDPEGASVLRAMHDEDSFFRIDPVKNLVERSRASAENLAYRDMQKNFYDGIAVDDLTPQQFALRKSEFFQDGSEHVAVLETKGGVRPLTRAEAVEKYAIKPELQADYENARHIAQENYDQQIQANAINAENALADLQSSRRLHEGSIDDDLAIKQDELAATANVKRAVSHAKQAKAKADELRETLAYHNRKKSGRALQTENMHAQERYRKVRSQIESEWLDNGVTSGRKTPSGADIRPRKGHLYRSFYSIDDLKPSPYRSGSGWRNDLPSDAVENNAVRWNPRGKAASEGFGWADFDQGFLVEFEAPKNAEDIVAGGSYKNIEKGNWSTPIAKSGRPKRIFISDDSPPLPSDIAELRKAFPEAEIVEISSRWGPEDAPVYLEDSIQDGYLRVSKSFGSVSGNPDFEKQVGKILSDRAADAAAEAKTAKAQIEVFRDAVDDILDEQLSTAEMLTSGFGPQGKIIRNQAAETAAGIAGVRRRAVDVAAEIRRRGLDPKRVAEEALVQRAVHRDGGLALDEAAKRIVGVDKEGKPVTLFDRIFARLDPNTKIKIVRREDFQGFRAMMDDMRRPDPFRNNSFVRFLDQFKTAWAGHTVNSPLFIATRIKNALASMGAAAMNGLFSPSAQMESLKVSQALRKLSLEGPAAMEALKAIPVKGLNISLYDAFNQAVENGAINFSSAFADEVGATGAKLATIGTTGEAATQALQYFKTNPVKAMADLVVPPFGRKNPTSPLYALGSQMEAAADQQQRFASFLGGLKKGMKPAEAGQAVRKALYDSSLPLTWTERTLFRRVMPFYSFSKYALRNSAELFLQRPATLTWLDKYQRESKRATGVENLDTILPPFVAEGFGIVTKNTETGPRVKLFGSWFNIGEAAQVAHAFDSEGKGGAGATSPLIRYAMNKMHPALRTIFEQVSNRDFFSDRELEAYPGESGEFMGVVLPKRTIRVAQQLRFLNELSKLNVFNASEFRVMSNAVQRSAVGKSPEMNTLELFLGSAFSPAPFLGERTVRAADNASYAQSKDEAVMRDVKGKILRRLAAPDALPTKQKDLAALRDLYKETAGRVLRRTDAAAPYQQGANKASKQQLRRLQIRKLAGTGTADNGE